MILIDTSAWVSHFHKGDADLGFLLSEGLAACHPFVIGELACGNLRNRKEILSLLQTLPGTPVVSNSEHLHFIELKKIHGIGLGFVDIHLLASVCLTGCKIYTHDKTLHRVSTQLGINYTL
ncbi:MAG: PIN domain-containing protein [Fibrobacterota bacterium]